MKTKLEEMILWYELRRLQERYVNVIDTDRLEEWLNFFTEDCVYDDYPQGECGSPPADGYYALLRSRDAA